MVIVRLTRAMGIVALVLVVGAFSPSELAAQEDAGRRISVQLPSQGVAFFVWGGGTPEDVVSEAALQGCGVSSVWATHNGAFISHIIGAPAFVNRAFANRYPGDIPQGEIVGVVCEKIVPPPPPTQGSGPDCRTDWPEIIRQEVLPRIKPLASVCYFFFDTLSEAEVALGRDLSDKAETYNRRGYVAYYESPAGRIVVVGPGGAGRPGRPGGTLTHELMHSVQHLQVVLSEAGEVSGESSLRDAWLATPAGEALLELGGWTRTTRPDGATAWEARDNPVPYVNSPFEAGAEMATIYLNPGGVAFTQQEQATWLPPPFREWVEQYMVDQ
ncbi:MAG: hypothetical protein WD850_01065 [Candidatus Spechtbacterales bacterium]